MNIQRLRNLTTGRLHTEMSHIYQDMEYLTGEGGLMTHMLPNVFHAMQPWLMTKVTDPRFWEDKYDKTHVGEFEISPMTDDERKVFLARYRDLPSPLAGKDVIAIQV